MDGKVQEMLQDEEMREQFIERMIDQYNQQADPLACIYLCKGDHALAEEITQDVFLTCYHKIDTFRNDSSIRTWLYRITINKCKDQLRKKKFGLCKLSYLWRKRVRLVPYLLKGMMKKKECKM
ncbi:hypothetical protein IMZ31_03405 [Pontibacillus sp. ALD_SL1]|uniref:sigma factor n=1 Tax=Pontibacillus sp. ALD_SL1 TaxID=2777185 RepID=UPI001A96050E|nr:sigma factor [Pontibacillus sp. ALD_SL1]QST01812.1 hypothetical protein IMZ31_03405 [Pontibacillus sp. ALD_SL1]